LRGKSEYLVERIRPEADALSNTILKAAAREARQGVDEGSFETNVLSPLKQQDKVSLELAMQVNQVRRYRNWVAHGRRERPEQPVSHVSPKMAYERLGELLAVLGIAVESELGENDQSGERGENNVEGSAPPPTLTG
jgi:hypothetical protein